MSKYRNNMVNLDNEFKTARADFTKKLERAQAAKKYARELMTKKATSAEEEANLLRAQADSREAENELETVWNAFRAKAADTLNAVRRDIEQNTTTRAEDIDENAVKLLESGIMTVADYEYMAEQYKDNRTMLRLISKFVDKAKTETEDKEEKSRFSALLDGVKNIDKAKLDALDILETMVNACTGAGIHGTERAPAELTEKKAARWEELTANAFKIF